MKIYVIAGEPSGDLLASGLMRALGRAVPDVEFRGVGGDSMTAAGGFRSLFDIAEISVMGIFEVLPRLPLILRRIRQTVKDIEQWNPDVLVTVDSWGFVSALLTKLHKHGSKVPKIHYVAPQVWAWKKGRAKNVARLVDRLMTLLPDEGRWFEKYGLQCDFVGHPVVERIAAADLDREGFRAENGIPADANVIAVLPGSRHSEVRRLLPILKDAVSRLAVENTDLFVVVPTVAGVAEEVRRGFEGAGFPVRVVTGESNRYNAFAVSDFALAKSGTVSLELAALGVPHLIAYKFNAFTDLAARLLVKVRFANLINLLADRAIIPEFLLWECRPESIAACTQKLFEEPAAAEKQVADAQKIMQRLRLPDTLPSDRAAQIVIEMAE
jgi:lipid-A-disaccharide synthase